MGKEAEKENEEDEAISAEDVLYALAVQAREHPETFNAESFEEALKEAGFGELWESAGEEDENEEELDDENDEDDEDEENEENEE